MSMKWRAMGLADTARHVIGCHLTQETRFEMCVDDVADNTCQALLHGVHIAAPLGVDRMAGRVLRKSTFSTNLACTSV